MKTSLIGTCLLILGAGSALAADLPTVKAPSPVYPLPTPMWTGFYAGLNAGYDWGTSANAVTDATPLFDAIALTADGLDPAHVVSGGLVNGGTALANSGTARLNPSGFLGGGQVGYNYQWGSSFVVGLEADFQGADVRGAATMPESSRTVSNGTTDRGRTLAVHPSTAFSCAPPPGRAASPRTPIGWRQFAAGSATTRTSSCLRLGYRLGYESGQRDLLARPGRMPSIPGCWARLSIRRFEATLVRNFGVRLTQCQIDLAALSAGFAGQSAVSWPGFGGPVRERHRQFGSGATIANCELVPA
jgi:opacity protein-like surface antigen